ncbi:MAG TPA: carboxypeptidase-like regulatory domain-containing protein, partial [Granulicella sp.]
MRSLSSLRCPAASLSLPAVRWHRTALAISLLVSSATIANAVVVRGHVTDVLGKPASGARVQLIESGKVASIAYAGPDGSYEIRWADPGRFTLLGSARGFLPSIGEDFYSGAMDVLEKDVVLA